MAAPKGKPPANKGVPKRPDQIKDHKVKNTGQEGQDERNAAGVRVSGLHGPAQR